MLKRLGILFVFIVGILVGRMFFSAAPGPIAPSPDIAEIQVEAPPSPPPAPSPPPVVEPEAPKALAFQSPPMKKPTHVPEPVTERQDESGNVPMKWADVSVMGAIPGNTVIEYVERHDRQINHCYQQELRANPELKGRMATEFVIGPGGRVQEAKVTRNFTDFNQPKLENCVLGILKRMAFPASADGKEVYVIYPLHFPKREKAHAR